MTLPKLTPEEAAGMTVNERLFAAGLLDRFDRAVRSRDEDTLRAILSDIHLTEENAALIIREVLRRGSTVA